MPQDQTVWAETVGIVAIVVAVLIYLLSGPMIDRYRAEQALERAHIERMAACRKGA